MLELELIEKYKDKGILKHDNELYLPIKTIFVFLSECTENQLAMIGIDFFHISGGKIIPVHPINGFQFSETIENYNNWNLFVTNCNSEALAVINFEKKIDETLYCNPVVVSRIEMVNLLNKF